MFIAKKQISLNEHYICRGNWISTKLFPQSLQSGQHCVNPKGRGCGLHFQWLTWPLCVDKFKCLSFVTLGEWGKVGSSTLKSIWKRLQDPTWIKLQGRPAETLSCPGGSCGAPAFRVCITRNMDSATMMRTHAHTHTHIQGERGRNSASRTHNREACKGNLKSRGSLWQSRIISFKKTDFDDHERVSVYVRVRMWCSRRAPTSLGGCSVCVHGIWRKGPQVSGGPIVLGQLRSSHHPLVLSWAVVFFSLSLRFTTGKWRVEEFHYPYGAKDLTLTRP